MTASLAPAIALEVHDLTMSYRHRPVLWDIDFALPTGSVGAIVGPNGAGKSTLLKGIVGLIPTASGAAFVHGAPVAERRALIAYVPQRSEVDWDFPISALEVVLMGRYGRLAFYQRPRAEDYTIARNALEKVGLQGLESRQIKELSGGQQQRVFIARALAQEAQVYLLDEPFAGVDATTEAAIVAIFRELSSAGKTILAVHHDLTSVTEYFTWAALLNMRLVAAGDIETTITRENLSRTYGGRLGALEKLSEHLRQERWTGR